MTPIMIVVTVLAVVLLVLLTVWKSRTPKRNGVGLPEDGQGQDGHGGPAARDLRGYWG